MNGGGEEWADGVRALVSYRLEHLELLSSLGSKCWRMSAHSKTGWQDCSYMLHWPGLAGTPGAGRTITPIVSLSCLTGSQELLGGNGLGVRKVPAVQGWVSNVERNRADMGKARSEPGNTKKWVSATVVCAMAALTHLYSQGDVHFLYLADDSSHLFHQRKKYSFSLAFNPLNHLMLQR